MKAGSVLLLSWLGAFWPGVLQAQNAVPVQPEPAVADWLLPLSAVDDDAQAAATEQVAEQLDALAAQPLDLKTATRDDLLQLPFLTPRQVDDLLTYVARYGPLCSAAELAMVPSLDARQQGLLARCLRFADDQQPPRQRAAIGGELVATGRVPFYRRQGDRQGYAGYPYRHSLRYTMTAGSHLRAGLVGAQDAGEPFFSQPNRWGYDHYSFFVEARRLGPLRTAVAGRYRLRLGMGLVVNGNLSLGKLAELSHEGRSSVAITPHSSRMAANYLQGAAATVALPLGHSTPVQQLELTAFASRRTIDATLRGDTALATLLTTGYHRTASELARKDNAAEWLLGGRVGWQGKGLSVGLAAVADGLSLPLQPLGGTPTPSQRYRMAYPAGQHFFHVSTDYAFFGRRVGLQGETALGPSGALATLNHLTLSLPRHLTLVAIQRFYSYRYAALHASALAEGGRVGNESGVLAGLRWNPSRRLSLTAYTDYAYFPWARYGVAQASHATDHLLALRVDHRPWRFEGRYRLRLTQANDSTRTRLVGHSQHRLRLAATCSLPLLVLRSQVDAALAGPSAHSRGVMVSQDVTLRLPVAVSLHAAYFHTTDYDSRLYAYERNLRYAFSFPSYFGQGLRLSLLASWRLSRRLTLAAKLATTRYFDRSQIGSGLQLIDHSSQTDLDLQLCYRFR